MSQVDKDLVMILENSVLRVDVRLKGWDYLLALTATEEGLDQILMFEKYIPFIQSYINEDRNEIETLLVAHRCLINISSSKKGAVALFLVAKGLVVSLLNSICNTEYEFVEQRCYILSNLSTHCNLIQEENISKAFTDLWKEKLMHCFCSNEPDTREKYKFLALVFANISRQPEGRRLFIDNDKFLKTFLLCINSDEPDTRRLGIVLTMRNCCFGTRSHKRLLEDLNILPSLLLPLMGPEEYEEEHMEKLPLDCQYLESSKERERSPQIRKALVQALSLLCYTEEGWNHLKEKSVYYVARELHTWEQDSDVKEAVETLVGYLLVLNYTDNKQTVENSSYVIPAETDILHDIPDVII